MTIEEEYNCYRSLHHDFSVSYASLHKHMLDFYPLPKKFIEETGPRIENYVRNYSIKEVNAKKNLSVEMIFYFSGSFSQFAAETVKLFDDYRLLYDESGMYMKRLFKLKESNPGQNPAGSAEEYIEMIPGLNALVGGLKSVEEKVCETEKKLAQLEAEWQSIQQTISS
jgi:hypothetical protein